MQGDSVWVREGSVRVVSSEARNQDLELGAASYPVARRQAAAWFGASRRSSGSVSEQTSAAMGQRVWKWQPDGGLMGLGTSPCRIIFLRRTDGSGIGTADNSASV